ncbi:MAG: Holliday junction resolvase RuvX [Candidatus Zambryskibacteria bacterium]
MKYLSIDFGSKRVGIAISDEEGKMAFPYSVIQNDKKLLGEVERIIEKEKTKEIVMGESRDFKGEPNKIMASIEEFKKKLEEGTNLKVNFEPEFLTSAQAERGIESRRPDTKGIRGSGSRLKRRDKNEMHDASAATIILQSYLDRLK